MATTNLQIVEITAAQNQKEVTANTAFEQIDNAMNAVLSLTITGNTTITDSQFNNNHVLSLGGTPAGAFNLDLPARSRTLIIENNSGQTATVQVTGAPGTSVAVPTGTVKSVYSDGTNVDTSDSTSNFTDLGEVPSSFTGNAGKMLYVNSGETALEFASNIYWDEVNDHFGIGVSSPSAPFHIVEAAGSLPSISAVTVGLMQRNVATNNQAIFSIISGSAASARVTFGDDSVQQQSWVQGDNNDNSLSLHTGGNSTAKVYVSSTGDVGIGNSSPDGLLHVSGEVYLTELSADPTSPVEGTLTFWMSDGTGSGGDGDLVVKSQAGAVTETIPITDHANGRLQPRTKPIEEISGTTYTNVAADNGKMKYCTNAAAVTFTIDDAINAAEDEITVVQDGAGQITFSAAAGMTLNSLSGNLKSAGQFAVVHIKFETNAVAWVYGDLVA